MEEEKCMNEKKQNHQTEQKMEQKEMLSQMKQEIETLKSNIKQAKLRNVKIWATRNLKISARSLQRVAPYALTAGIVTGCFTLTHNTPFYLDEWKVYPNIMTEFDNFGNIRTKSQKDHFKDDNGKKLDNSDSMLYYYSKWEKNDDGFYSRSIQTYSIKKKTYEDIVKLFEEEKSFEKENLSLMDFLGYPTSNIMETRNNLTNEELQEESFMEAFIYNKDKNNYVTYRETIYENRSDSMLYVLITMFFELLLYAWRDKCSYFSFKVSIQEIKRKYQPLDVDTLKKTLKLKQDNYSRITKQ